MVLVKTDVSEEHIASIISGKRISELGTTLAATNNYFPSKGQLLQEPHGVSSQKTTAFIVTAVKTSNLT
jgi:hypothetical protein